MAENAFHEPTDEDLSARFGVPVFSFRPEDLPHFRPGPMDDYFQDEVEARIDAVIERFRAVHPTWDEGRRSVQLLALNKDGALTTFAEDDKIAFIALLRPSLLMSPAAIASMTTRIEERLLNIPIPPADRSFINTAHEIGHMVENTESGLNFNPSLLDSYSSELHAESYALTAYADEGGDPAVIKAVIQERALAGFIHATPQYFIAPALYERFISRSGLEPDPQDVINRYLELRLRTGDALRGAHAFRQMPSDELLPHIAAWRQAHRDDPDGMADSRDSFTLAAKAFDYPFPADETLSTLMVDVLENPRLAPLSAAYGHQILEAARDLAPGLRIAPPIHILLLEAAFRTSKGALVTQPAAYTGLAASYVANVMPIMAGDDREEGRVRTLSPGEWRRNI